MKFGLGVVLIATLSLSGCNLPRGAALESEVLRAQKGDPGPDGEALPAFEVFQITRSSLPVAAAWPHTGARAYDWIRRQQQPASMIIAPGDVMTVTVWDSEENSLLATPGQRVVQLQDIQVSPGGSVFLPYLGEMRVAGMAPTTARKKIEERYVATIPSAQVQVSVRPGRANTANLVAGVRNPGVYPLVDRDVTLLGLLSIGGGVEPGLPNPQIRLFRDGKVFGISVARLYEEPGLDTTLVGGDRVIVQAENRVFLSLGAAGKEARHIFPRDRLSALEALSVIGGLDEGRANPKGVLILREYSATAVNDDPAKGPPQARMVFTIDLTSADGLFSAGQFEIMPNDLVYATESPVVSARTVLGLLGTSLGLAARF